MIFSVVIPTYNHCEDLLRPCLESIKNTTELSNIEIIVVANGCKDNTREYVESLGEPFKLIWVEEAIGYTRATNIGIKASTGDFVILLNNDTVMLGQPRNQWIEILKEPFYHIKDLAASGAALNYDEHSGRHFLIFFCVMIKREALDNVGPLDEIFSPGFGEDTDWCIRAENLGYTIIQVPTVDPLRQGIGKIMEGNFPIYHVGEGTFDHEPKFQELIARNSEILRNRYRGVLPHGAFSDQDINVYKSFVGRVPKGSNIAEVGVWKGRSLCSVADIIKENDLRVTAIDSFEGSVSEGNFACGEPAINIQSIFERSLKRFEIDNRTKVIKGDSTESASLFPDNYFSCVFIDADHSYESAKKDMDAWWPKVKPGGILCGHDYLWYWSVGKALKEKFGEESIHTDLCNMWYVDKPMIYDCFMFANELDVLEIRLNTLYDVVDKFVIVEAPTSQSGRPKPLYFEENKQRYAKFLDKIIHIVVNDMPEGKDPWVRENFQRDATMRGLTQCKDEDLIIISDADEIVSPEALKKYNKEMGIVGFEQKLCYYYLNCVAGQVWDWCKIAPYKTLKTIPPCGIRYAQNTPLISGGGWHLSFMGGVERIAEKIDLYAHQEYNNDKIKNRERLERLINEGKDIFERDIKYSFVNIDNSYPKYLLDNLDKFKHLIKSDVVPVELKKKLNGGDVTAVVSTKNRYFTTLPLVISAIATQTVTPKELVIYDDGEKKDLREEDLYKNLFSLLSSRGIGWRVQFGAEKGQVWNHDRSITEANTDLIWRLDDDNVPRADCLENLLEAMNSEDRIGAVGGLVLDPKTNLKKHILASNRIEDIYLGLNVQWYEAPSERFEVDHLYSTFLYRKEASKHRYCLELSRVGHREETIFTYEMKRAGWKILVDTSAVTYHLRAAEGGIREKTDESLWNHDEMVFMKKMLAWQVVPREYKVAILDNGLGDHFIFKKVLPDLIKKHGKDNIIISACYPEVFAESGVKIISIADSAALVPNKDDLNIYKFMIDHSWKKTVEEAYRGLYQL